MTRATMASLFLAGGVISTLLTLTSSPRAETVALTSWDAKAAAAYLDQRQTWWSSWPNANREGASCVSCHTTLPYALARPVLRGALHERTRPSAEVNVLENVVRRVRNWKDVAPYYSDQRNGLPKTSEARGTEAILNASILARRDASDGALTEDTRLAFANLWALQMKTGDLNGAWAWLYFRLEPWEGAESAYFGATLAAVAVGTAPGGYASSPEIQDNLKLLRAYLGKQLERQPTFNRLMLLWAGARLSGVLTAEQRDALVAEAFAKQQSDGGWSMSSIGSWKRTDGSVMDPASDGYATGLAAFALQQAGVPSSDPRLEKGLQWLVQHQDRATGKWTATSLNRNRDPESEPSRFMSDAATAFAVLALTGRD
jgi:squalene-hopene/tetraprenyl-beta-curcumene cyclase